MDGQAYLKLKVLLDEKGVTGQIKKIEESSKININTGGQKTVTTMRTIQDESGKIYKTTTKVNEATGATTASIKEAGRATKSWGSGFASTIGKVAKFGAATAVIGAVTGALYSGIDAIKEYDKAITNFKKVSDLSGDALAEYGVKLGKMGEDVAKSRTEMIDAAGEFRKSSYSDEDSATLAKVASLYQNIADEELTAADASSVIISQMKAFNIDAEDATHIIDAINEVSNNFALSSSDIGKGLTAAGSALSTYGNSFEQTIG